MKITKRSLLFPTLTALLAVALSVPAKADTAPVTLTQANPNSYSVSIAGEDVYTSPYVATVNGTQGVLVVCDSFTNYVSVGQSWTATVTSFGNLNQAITDGQLLYSTTSPGTPNNSSGPLTPAQGYLAVGYLAETLLNTPNLTASQSIDLSTALWAVFDPSLVPDLPDSAAVTDYNTAVADALNGTLSASQFSNLEILTGTLTIGGTPQEFIAETPEASFFLLLGLGLIAMVLFLRFRHSKLWIMPSAGVPALN